MGMRQVLDLVVVDTVETCDICGADLEDINDTLAVGLWNKLYAMGVVTAYPIPNRPWVKHYGKAYHYDCLQKFAKKEAVQC
jgi:hypothetical protein